MPPENSWQAFKRTAIVGAKWRKSWPTNPAEVGGGDSLHKPSKTTSVLNGVCGSTKQSMAVMFQKRGFLELFSCLLLL
jgi:hypothetical protein